MVSRKNGGVRVYFLRNFHSVHVTVWKNTVKHYHAQKFSVKPQLQNYAKSTFTNA